MTTVINNSDGVVNYDGASKLTSIKKPTLAWMVHKRKIPHIRLGPRMVRFRISELAKWMEERSVPVNESAQN